MAESRVSRTTERNPNRKQYALQSAGQAQGMYIALHLLHICMSAISQSLDGRAGQEDDRHEGAYDQDWGRRALICAAFNNRAIRRQLQEAAAKVGSEGCTDAKLVPGKHIHDITIEVRLSECINASHRSQFLLSSGMLLAIACGVCRTRVYHIAGCHQHRAKGVNHRAKGTSHRAKV